ncbi:MAG TPA: hypothetical protein EYQ27_04355 [Gemmatimonadetes bacterium]|nr:hypothetical protein [Gemmatimonadota bacterium]
MRPFFFAPQFVAAHPAVTVITPGTSNGVHMADNLMAQSGRVPDEQELARMVEVVDALPPAPPRGGGGQ